MRDQDYRNPHPSPSSGFAHPCVSVRCFVYRSLIRTKFSSTLTSLISLLSTVHVYPPSRVGETRVVAVTIAATVDVVVVVILL
jgi:hypothetical protein